MISKADKKFLNEHGYLIVRNFFNDKQLKFLTEYSLDKKKKLRGKRKYIKIYREYPKFIFKCCVEYPFNSQINKHVFKEFSNLNYKKFFCDVVIGRI